MLRGGLEDTICAIATPAGEGGIGIVRLSGSLALPLAEGLVRLRSGQALRTVTSHMLHLADLLIPAPLMQQPASGLHHENRLAVCDEALIVYMKAPRSFTGEDVVEIQSHGGGFLLSLLCRACVSAGARLAEPGEFTKRAFLNGRLDLSQAEAVLDTIRAKSAASLSVAQRHLRGDLAREVDSAREGLLNLLAHVEAGIDFVEEEIAFLEKAEMTRTIDQVASMIQGLQSTAREGRLLREGARVVIAGRPNVGKSSILNRLLKEERAIVTAIPGTTRDVIEESIDLSGVRISLVDTAGMRDTDDIVEREGIKRSQSAQQDADLRVIVIDGSSSLSADDRALIDSATVGKHVIAINKADLPTQVDLSSIRPGSCCVALSAKTGDGIDDLRTAIRSQLVGPGAEVAESIMVTNVRHHTALERARDSLDHASESIAAGMAAELVAIDIRAAADALGEITGAITTDEILERIFSEFCIGK